MAATVYWSKGDGAAYVAMNALPKPPQGKQYQLWVIQNGKPVSMGVLPDDMANTPGMQKVNMAVMSADAFAISLEIAGGSPSPTEVYVVGKA
jgi:anti-sigma-K factor RskA